MHEYSLTSVWHIAAPVEAVWDAIVATGMNPTWWPYIEEVTEIVPGDARGLGSVRRYVWRTRLLYKLRFEIEVTRMERPVLLEGIARGELEGRGRWEFESQGRSTLLRHRWQVRTVTKWMNVLAPIAAAIFAWNHAQVMKAGAEGLARHLGVALLAFRHGADA